MSDKEVWIKSDFPLEANGKTITFGRNFVIQEIGILKVRENKDSGLITVSIEQKSPGPGLSTNLITRYLPKSAVDRIVPAKSPYSTDYYLPFEPEIGS